MPGKIESLTRRNFIAAGSATIAAPVLANVAGAIPEAKAAETAKAAASAKAAEKNYTFVDQKSCDLVVLGGGGSGLIVAVRAAQLSGKKVIVLEKDTEAGGAMRGARTVRVFASKWQAKRNIPDTTAEYAHEAMNRMYWWLDEKLVNNCLRGTGQFFDWLCEQGENMEDKFYPGKYVFAHSPYEPVGPQRSAFGAFVVGTMKAQIKSQNVELLTGHRVVDIEVENGKIVAAIAQNEKGHIRVACKACVLSTGSWIRNEEILKKYAPKYFEARSAGGGPGGAPAGQAGMSGGPGGAPAQSGEHEGAAGPGGGGPGGPGGGGQMSGPSHDSPMYTGDGIPLAEKVGAFVDYDSFVIRPMGPNPSTQSKVCTAMTQTPFIVTVDGKGKRYACESVVMNLGFFDGGSVLVANAGGKSCDIFNDETIAAAFKYSQLPYGEQDPIKEVDLVPGYKVSIPSFIAEIQQDLEKYKSSITQANTIEELAEKIGVDKAALAETINTYNEGCAQGIDQFFKSKKYLVPLTKGPYYACQGGLGSDGAFGGVRVNHEMQAYRADRKSLVEGLYVTGDFASGRHVNVSGVKWQVLNDLSWALSSGFLAGTNVAAYLQKPR
jgi:fumarate reductase flavoprotein subunit